MPVVKSKYRGSREYSLAYSALVAAAHNGAMLTYEGVARLTGLQERGQVMAREVGHLVGEISEDEVESGRPMLSALVVRKNTGLAGKGFFKLAGALKQFNGKSKADERAFLAREKRKLYEFWK